MKRLALIVAATTLVAFLIFFFSTEPRAKPSSCYPAQQLMDDLHDLHNEKVVFRGIGMRGHVTVVTLDVKSQRWTAYVVKPVNPPMACIVDWGSSGSSQGKSGERS